MNQSDAPTIIDEPRTSLCLHLPDGVELVTLASLCQKRCFMLLAWELAYFELCLLIKPSNVYIL